MEDDAQADCCVHTDLGVPFSHSGAQKSTHLQNDVNRSHHISEIWQ
jgi:hypothetical protein